MVLTSEALQIFDAIFNTDHIQPEGWFLHQLADVVGVVVIMTPFRQRVDRDVYSLTIVQLPGRNRSPIYPVRHCATV